MRQRGTDNFDFDLIGGAEKPFLGYISSFDKTSVSYLAMIKGSQNVVKTYRGTIAPRPGLKIRGSSDTTEAGVLSSFEWADSTGRTMPLRVANNKLEVESDIVTDGEYVWYELFESSTVLNPARTLTRFSFNSWWDGDEVKDRLVMVRGDSNILHWSGGIAKISVGSAGVAGGITGTAFGSNAGSGYVVGDVLTLATGSGGTVTVTSVSSGAITGYDLTTRGSGYTVANDFAVTGGTGTGFLINVTSIATVYTLTKQGTETWAEVGFATNLSDEKRLVISGVEYSYLGGEDTVTLTGVTTDTSSLVADSVAIQSVFVATNTPSADFTNDFIEIVNNQLAVFSLTARIAYLSADVTVSTLGFLNFTNAGDLVTGDPTSFVLDEPPTAVKRKGENLFVSAGISSWYKVTPNVPILNVFSAETITTQVEKFPGTGLSGCKAFEFVDALGDDIVYLDQANQLRTLGIVKDYSTNKNPMLSLPIHDELTFVDFTGGHLRTIDNIVYITAPVIGTHFMYEVRESIDNQGNFVAERFWQPPQISSISRFAVIDGIVYGHSNSNPQMYQIWDTGQWHDDNPSGEFYPYTSIMRMAYRNHGLKYGYLYSDKMYLEGYMGPGNYLNGYVFLDYKGGTGIKDFIISDPQNEVETFISLNTPSLGEYPIGQNPLGDGIIEEPDDRELQPKFRTIVDLEWENCFEYALQVYSTEPDSRWEILYIGTNAVKDNQSPTFIRR